MKTAGKLTSVYAPESTSDALRPAKSAGRKPAELSPACAAEKYAGETLSQAAAGRGRSRLPGQPPVAPTILASPAESRD
jgi:hypothetical protein